uniref:TRAF-type domain-containing protein n=1 Tax=Zea mays TaxID=4577 RepID=A0A804MTN8_MAIZE
MEAADSESVISTFTCPHCQREVPSSNIALHSAHCARNLQKCEHCGDMVARKLMDEHYDENHAPSASYGIFIQAYNAHKGCSRANTVSLNCLQLIFLNIRICVEIGQNIVKVAGSISDFVNGLDMNSSSIRF